MKMIWNACAVLASITLMASPSLAQKEKEAEGKKPIVVELKATAQGESDGDQQKKVTVNVIEAKGEGADKILDAVRKQLESSGIDEAKREKILSTVKKSLESKLSGENVVKVMVHSEEAKKEGDQPPESKDDIHVEVNSDVVLMDKSGKRLPLLLKEGKPLTRRVMMVQGDEHMNAIKEKVKAQLEANGIDEKVIEKVLKGLGSSDGPKGMVQGFPLDLNAVARQGMGQVQTQDRFIIGVALELDEESEGDENAKGKLSVQSVYDDSPADDAGIEVHDVIVKVDGKSVKTPQDLIALVQEAGKKDRKLEILIERDGKELEINVKPKKESTAIAGWPAEMQGGQGLPEGLKKAMEGMPTRGFVLPPGVQGFSFAPSNANQELSEVKEELESLKSELKELKSLIKSLKSGK